MTMFEPVPLAFIIVPLLLGVSAIAISVVLVVAACINSSRISRDEEAEYIRKFFERNDD